MLFSPLNTKFLFIVKLKYEENILANTVETIIGTVPLLIPNANAIHSIIWNNPISTINDDNDDSKYLKNEPNIQIVDKTTKISMNILMFWSFFKKNKPYD